tara:strand:+ start:156 stop:872 length:717 start_codon:yes stop_codon:yes gene_type:complete
VGRKGFCRHVGFSQSAQVQTNVFSLSLSLSLSHISNFPIRFSTRYICEYSPLKRARCVVSDDDDRTFREFLWLSKRCSATPADHAAATEDAKRTLRHILLLPDDDTTKEGSKDTTEGFKDSSSVRTQKARQFLLSKIGALKMRAASGVLRDLRAKRKTTRNNDSDDENDDDNDGRSVSTTFVLRDGALVAKDDVDDVATKGRRVADGRLSNEEAWTYHTRLMKRQYYGKTPPRSSEPF